MTTTARRLRRAWRALGGRIGVATYEHSDGRWMTPGSKEVTVLMLTSPGRSTGLPRRTCVAFHDLPVGRVVWGTGSGAPTDPDWFRNLRAAARAGTPVTVQHGDHTYEARPRELTGDERDAVWGQVLGLSPGVARLAIRARRTVPVAVLEPLTDERHV